MRGTEEGWAVGWDGQRLSVRLWLVDARLIEQGQSGLRRADSCIVIQSRAAAGQVAASVRGKPTNSDLCHVP